MQREKQDNGPKTKPVHDVLDNDSCITPAIDFSVVCTCSHHFLLFDFAGCKGKVICNFFFSFFLNAVMGKWISWGVFCGGGVIQ